MTSPSSPLRRSRRPRTTKLRVRAGEHGSRALITIGGVGTIIAVTGIFVFLFAVVTPLFRPSTIGERRVVDGPDAGAVVAFVPDEYGRLGAVFDDAGGLRVLRLDNGEVLVRQRPFGDQVPTAASFPVEGRLAAFGFADGTVRMADFGYDTEFLVPGDVPRELRHLEPGEVATMGEGVLEITGEGKARWLRFGLSLKPPVSLEDIGAVRLLDHVSTGSSATLAALDEAGTLVWAKVRERTNLLTGETTFRREMREVDYGREPGEERPRAAVLQGRGDSLLVAWNDGRARRIDLRTPEEAVVAEHVRLVEDGERLTALVPMIGRTTVIVGDGRGRLSAWFPVRLDEVGLTSDGLRLERGKTLPALDGAVVSVSPSSRSRLMAAGSAAGHVAVYQVTTGERLAEGRMPSGSGTPVVRLLPKEDGVVALGEGIVRWPFDKSYPEATPRSLFLPVWYEGAPTPDHVWQSSAATDDYEPKLGLWPLVFGTLKATLYSMLFGAPLALLAALFTSEFLSRRARTPIKSTIEIMASLPSVVLGFLAGIVIAPFAASVLPTLLAAFLVVPGALLAGAYLWQLLPGVVAVRLSGAPRMAAMGAALLAGGLLATVVGPWMQDLLFAGNIILWLGGTVGTAAGGWFFLLLPLSGLVVVAVAARTVSPWFRNRTRTWDRARCARTDLARIAALGLLAAAVAAGLSLLLTSLGADPREGVFGRFEVRNTLVVGFVMGFAIIPIIYTLAEDALSSVPEHLRLASLGAGATPWQTAVRVIVPTAMSGLFSAVMIGLGRAVGETMIVLMATGNTPVRDWNIFNGFRTLSANIAVELPEAVVGSTHYRTLFLAALVLFAMTFVLNTLAESVRLRFRRRAYQL